MGIEGLILQEALKYPGIGLNIVTLILVIIIYQRVKDIKRGMIKAHERIDRHLNGHKRTD